MNRVTSSLLGSILSESGGHSSVAYESIIGHPRRPTTTYMPLIHLSHA